MPDHDDRRKFADATKNLPAWAQLSVADIELMDEETYEQAIHYGTTTEAIAAMQRRLKLLNTQKAQTIDAFETAMEEAQPESILTALNADIAKLTDQIAATEQRLADYRKQHEQRN
jgi:septal ring factor EnvC (AmiA/AmiB activator)